eukprot:6866108-Karenia_brevis.AAC.1
MRMDSKESAKQLRICRSPSRPWSQVPRRVMQLQKATSKTTSREPGRHVITLGYPLAFGRMPDLCIAFTQTIAKETGKYLTSKGLGENGKVKRYLLAR